MTTATRFLIPPHRRGHMAYRLLLFCLLQLSAAWQIVPEKRIPSYISESCAAALSQEISASVCNPMANRLIKGYFYSQETLNRTCTEACDELLGQYEDTVVSSCGEETWDNYFNSDETGEEPQSVPIRIIPNLTRYLFSLTCLKDDDRFCNVVIGTAAQLADPGSTLFGWAPLVNNETGIEAASSCDVCYVKRLRQEAGSPYYEGPRISSLSMYESLTSSCGVTDMPMTTSTLGFSTPTAPAAATPTCTGTTYTIQPGDDCYSISQSQSVGTGWLLDANDLSAWCSGFPATGSLCIANTCNVYTVQNNDTCVSIAQTANITEAQFRAWNPIINTGCYNLEKMNGTSVCVSSPGKPYVAPTNLTVTSSAGAEATAVPVPADIAQNTTTRCAQYHDVVVGEYCNLLSLKYGISLEDFITLNPAINDNCTNLFAEESYCVKAVGDINTYPGRPGYTSTVVATITTAAGPTTPFSLLPDSTMTPYERNNSQSPLADRTRQDCSTYFEGSMFSNVTLTEGGSYLSICALAADIFFAELESFGLWNPSLNVSLPECAFASDKSYCGQLYWDANNQTAEAEGKSYSFELRAGYIESCTVFEDVPLGWGCADIFDYYSLTVEQFYEYNPAVGSDCSNLWTNYAYCVSTDPPEDGEVEVPPATTTTSGSTTAGTSTTSTATGPTAPAATQAGQPATCNKWAVVGDGDGCWSLATDAGITLDQFYAWNPAVASDCSSGLWPDYAYCVGLSSGATTTTASPTTTTASVPTSTAPAAPGQTQSGQAANCNQWDMAEAGDSCWAIADRNGIAVAELYTWNTVLGTDGSACGTQIWPDYYYCIGVSA